MTATKILTLDSLHLIKRVLSLQLSIKSDFLLPLLDCFVHEEPNAIPKVVINTEIAEENLGQFLLRQLGDLPEEHVLHLFTQVLLGLQTLHQHGVSH